MKKQILSTISILVLGLMLSVGLSYAMPQEDPASTSTVVPSVITRGVTGQIKTAGLSVNTFSAAQNAEFKQQTFFQDLIRGGSPADTDSVLKIGGVDLGGVTRTVYTIITGKLTVDSTLASSMLNTANEINLCANDQGEIEKCTTQSTYSQNGYALVGQGVITGVCQVPLSVDREPAYQSEDKTVTVVVAMDNGCIRKQSVRMVPGSASENLDPNFNCGGGGSNTCSAIVNMEIINIQ
jgi:hypothetical protein